MTSPPQYYQPLSQVDFSPIPVLLRAHRHESSRRSCARFRASSRASIRTSPSPICGRWRSQFENDVYVDRLVTLLSASFAILATLLTAIGLYGTLSYAVTQRTRELGLQARPRRRAGATAGDGAEAGRCDGSDRLCRRHRCGSRRGGLAEAILFGVSGYDPIAFIAAVTVLALVALVAGLLPGSTSVECRADGCVALRVTGAEMRTRNPRLCES